MAAEPSQCGKRMSFDFSMDQMPNLESNPELFNLTTGMEMLAFQSKTRDANSLRWKEYFTRPGANQVASSTSSDFYQADDQFSYKPDYRTALSETTVDDLIHSSWQHNNRFLVDNNNTSLPSVLPLENRELTNQGLSLSLCSEKSSPSTIGLQTLELIRGTATQMQHQRHQPQQHQILQERFMGTASNLHQTNVLLKDSKYLSPCKDLLNEFCSLGTKITDPQRYKNKINQWQDENGRGTSRIKLPLNSSLDLVELQRRKSKLLSLLEEVDRRYRQYCEQMKSVVSSFEAVVGTGAGLVYSALASKAMSRHFRCLRDAIVFQINETNKAMGEKDPVAPGTTRGETPRLRLLEQTHRQERSLRQMNLMESHPWRPQRGLPERSVSLLRAWLFEHFLHPYPSDVDKHILARQTGLSRSQVSNWFINARVRLWKPMVEEMYLEESKDHGFVGPSYQSHSQLPYEDQKPTPDQLVRGDTGSLSSIINSPDKIHVKNVTNLNDQQQFGRDSEPFGVQYMGFASYNEQTSNTTYSNGAHQNFGNGVSLTLGLQQHGQTENGINLPFAPPSQHSLFFSRDDVEECEQLEYSILDEEVQNPPYRNLMGVQLLHDLAG